MALVEQGFTDAEVAEKLTTKGSRCIGRTYLLERTVTRVRVKQERAQEPAQRHSAGRLLNITADATQLRTC